MSQPTPRSPGRVAGKVALVTGAASGIGRAVALALAAEGAAVACADRDEPGAADTANAIVTAGGSAWSSPFDVTEESAWEAAVDALLRDRGSLDIAVNCAGIAHGAPIAETTLADWRGVLAVNLDGVFLGTKHAVRAMRKGGRGGSIVNVSSVAGVKAQPGAAAYCASKAAIIMLSKSVALECLKNGDKIRVNCISPTGVKTPMWNSMPFFRDLVRGLGSEDAAYAAMAKDSHSRWATPEEVAAAILFLASDESGFVTGTNLMFEQCDTA